MTRTSKPLKVLALGFALMFALLLAGCSNRTSSEGSAASESPATSSSAGPTGATSAGSPASASSIEDAVTDADQLLSDLDQDFKAD